MPVGKHKKIDHNKMSDVHEHIQKNDSTDLTTVSSVDSHSVQLEVESSQIVKEDNLQNQELKHNLVGEHIVKDLKMVQNGDGAVHDDGADEKMLRNDDKVNLAKKDEVKFISAGDQQNGDAKIDIGNLEKAFTGMTKEELMKYANDPFWIRLRWIFFISFWLIWAAMLIGAILIIVNAPKCAAPTPLAWYKQGPLIKFKTLVGKLDTNNNDVGQAKKLKAKGVIYELQPEETYSVKEPEVESKIKKLVETYKGTDIKVILDITPNFVTNTSKLFKEALDNPDRRSSFIWVEGAQQVPTSWRSLLNGSAWHELKPQNFILSQFGESRYDLFMNDSYVKNDLKNVLSHLKELGVKGFRLSNAIYFIINKDLNEESPSTRYNYTHDQYGFWTHGHTTFHEGLGDLLNEFKLSVKNASSSNSDDEVFLSVSDDIIRPEIFKTKSGSFGVDIPIYGRFTNALNTRPNSINKPLYEELERTVELVGNTTWLQWVYNPSNYKDSSSTSAYYMFLSLLPGTPVLPAFSAFQNLSNSILGEIENLRLSPSYMHGDFNIYHSGEIIAYSRIKSGNPGFLVVFNPTEINVVGNFSYADLPDKMTFDLLSENYNVTDVTKKGKVSSDTIQLSPLSTAILTYVPVKKN